MKNFLSKYWGSLLQFGIGAVILFLFTYHGFFAAKDCTNGEFLYCHLHPAGFFDVVGVILFYAGASFIIGVPSLFGIELYQEGKVPKYALGAVITAIIGVVMIYS
jgi:hypothetical protein